MSALTVKEAREILDALGATPCDDPRLPDHLLLKDGLVIEFVWDPSIGYIERNIEEIET